MDLISGPAERNIELHNGFNTCVHVFVTTRSSAVCAPISFSFHPITTTRSKCDFHEQYLRVGWVDHHEHHHMIVSSARGYWSIHVHRLETLSRGGSGCYAVLPKPERGPKITCSVRLPLQLKILRVGTVTVCCPTGAVSMAC